MRQGGGPRGLGVFALVTAPATHVAPGCSWWTATPVDRLAAGERGCFRGYFVTGGGLADAAGDPVVVLHMDIPTTACPMAPGGGGGGRGARRGRADALGSQRVAAVIVIPADFDQRAAARSVAELDAPQLGLLGELHGPAEGIVLPIPYRVAIAEHDLTMLCLNAAIVLFFLGGGFTTVAFLPG